MTTGDTMRYAAEFAEQSRQVHLEAGHAYMVDPGVQADYQPRLLGYPAVLGIRAGNAKFWLVDSRWSATETGGDYTLFQELPDGQIHRSSLGVRHGQSVRIGHMHNRKTFQLDGSVEDEHLDITYDDDGIVITNLDLSRGTIIMAPPGDGRLTGRIIDADPDHPGSSLTPNRTYGRRNRLTTHLGGLAAGRLDRRGGEWVGGYADKFRQAGAAIVGVAGKIRQELSGYHDLPPIISAELADALLDKAEIHGGEYKDQELTIDMLAEAGLEPKYRVKLEGADVYFSDTYYFSDNRLAVTGYVRTPDGKVVARSFWLSKSQGLWRALPTYIETENFKHFGKGHGQASLSIPIDAQAALGAITAAGIRQVKNQRLLFFGTTRDMRHDAEQRTYSVEVDSEPMLLDGNFYGRQGEYEVLPPAEVDFYGGARNPQAHNYARPGRTWRQYSPFYRHEILMETYPSNDGSITHIVGNDMEGHYWPAGTDTPGPVGSTGLREAWIDGGCLFMPLHEYHSESGGYGAGNRGGYANMWPYYLSKVPAIRRRVGTVH